MTRLEVAQKIERERPDQRSRTPVPVKVVQIAMFTCIYRQTVFSGPFLSTSPLLCSPLHPSPPLQSLHHNHPRHIPTAFSHLANLSAATSFSICGLNSVRPTTLIFFSSSKFSHTPTANPAAMAAPSAVVSRICGRRIGIEVRSACVWILWRSVGGGCG